MFRVEPKGRHWIIPLVFMVAGTFVTAYLKEPEFFYFGVGSWIFSSISVVWIIYITFFFMAASRELSVARLAESLKGLSPEQWSALGIKFPHLRIRWRGEPIAFFEDTAATMDQFERYMRESTARQTSPKRNWTTEADKIAWADITKFLEDMQAIYPQSHTGNHSWLWRGDMHRVIWQRYTEENLSVPNLNELEGEQR